MILAKFSAEKLETSKRGKDRRLSASSLEWLPKQASSQRRTPGQMRRTLRRDAWCVRASITAAARAMVPVTVRDLCEVLLDAARSTPTTAAYPDCRTAVRRARQRGDDHQC